ncbi:hypothetical protein EVAR_628_1 [Eumeta japonica]|uniref:Mariner Mos1 transposase n=1 Tax=Eumeta variegata TaxID=151549 RepID=A0A4C1SB80_EUMVA|nr:hypothetical protein EVAR_628_1 [Eumeta japonica]
MLQSASTAGAAIYLVSPTPYSAHGEYVYVLWHPMLNSHVTSANPRPVYGGCINRPSRCVASAMRQKIGLTSHPPYSPDLAPNDLYLFPSVKNKLSGQHFSNREETLKRSKCTFWRYFNQNHHHISPHFGFSFTFASEYRFLRCVGKMMDSVSMFFQTCLLQHELHKWWSEYNSDGCIDAAAIYRWRIRLYI